MEIQIPSHHLSRTESALRKRAIRRGYAIRKGRGQETTDNYGGYMLVDGYTNFALFGDYFNASLEMIAEFLEEHDQEEKRRAAV